MVCPVKKPIHDALRFPMAVRGRAGKPLGRQPSQRWKWVVGGGRGGKAGSMAKVAGGDEGSRKIGA